MLSWWVAGNPCNTAYQDCMHNYFHCRQLGFCCRSKENSSKERKLAEYGSTESFAIGSYGSVCIDLRMACDITNAWPFRACKELANPTGSPGKVFLLAVNPPTCPVTSGYLRSPPVDPCTSSMATRSAPTSRHVEAAYGSGIASTGRAARP